MNSLVLSPERAETEPPQRKREIKLAELAPAPRRVQAEVVEENPRKNPLQQIVEAVQAMVGGVNSAPQVAPAPPPVLEPEPVRHARPRGFFD